MLMILLTVLNIMIAASLPAWSAVIRRDKEEELIFRGLQYAEAIRLFKNRFERDPVRLEELIEVQPRTIRQLWKDPMTDDGKWGLIPALAPNPVVRQEPNGRNNNGGTDPDGNREENPGDGQGEDQEGENPTFGPKKGEIQVGPFKGVHSKSRKTSFLVFNGKDRYDEWQFTPDLFLGGNPNGMPPPEQGIPPQMPQGQIGIGGQPQRARWIGRPLPEFLQIPQGSALPLDDDQNPIPRGTADPNGRPQKP
jgi:type II secretory pathway pseudopilin PulG